MGTEMLEKLEMPYVFTATWIGLLGFYMFWLAQGSRTTKGTPDSPSFADESDGVETSSNAANETDETEDHPAFSPEGMISWMFERCNRRYEDALQTGDSVRAHAYNQRRALLADFMNFITATDDHSRDQATEMLNTIDDISSHESSPTKDAEEEEQARKRRSRAGHAAMLNLQGLMAMELQGCGLSETSSTESSWLGYAFLTTWTMMLIGYTWYVMKATKDFKFTPMPPMPDTLATRLEPEVHYDTVNVEGLAAWLFVRVRARLSRAMQAGNIGAGMRYKWQG